MSLYDFFFPPLLLHCIALTSTEYSGVDTYHMSLLSSGSKPSRDRGGTLRINTTQQAMSGRWRLPQTQPHKTPPPHRTLHISSQGVSCGAC